MSLNNDVEEDMVFGSLPTSRINVFRDEEVQNLRLEFAELRRSNKVMEEAILKIKMSGAGNIQGGMYYQATTRQQTSVQLQFGPSSSSDNNNKLLPVKMPNVKEPRVKVEAFDGTETYTGLGCDFHSWGVNFLECLDIAQQQFGNNFPESVKIKLLRENLKGEALSQFSQDWRTWCTNELGAVEPNLIKVMNRMN
jgi:hypothetical protein